MSCGDPPTHPDQVLVSVRPRLRGGGRGGSIAGGVAGPGHENSILSQLSAAKPVPLRPPLATGLPASPPPPLYSDRQTTTRPGSCVGPVQQLLHQQLTQKLPMSERDRQIAMVEEELKLTRKMMELERHGKEVNRMGRQVEEQRKKGVALNGFGRFEDGTCESETSEDMFKQMETARQEELARLNKDKLKAESSAQNNHSLPSKGVTKQKVKEMLERKKREMNLRNVTNSSAGSSLKNASLENTEVEKGGNDLFISDEENEEVAFASKATYYDGPTSLENADLTTVLGEDIPDQEMIWERIQRERREEEERMSGMKHNKVVQEQQEILRKIEEQNLARKKEEELTLKLIAEISLSDQRQQQLRRNEASAASTPYQAAATPYQAAAMPYQAAARPHQAAATPYQAVARTHHAAATPNQAAATPYQVYPAATTANEGLAEARPAAARHRDVGHVGEDWNVVGARVKEKVASLKIAAELDNKRRDTAALEEWRREMLEREEEERRRQIRKWEVNQKVRVVKSVDSFHDVEDERNSTTFRDILSNKNNAELNLKAQSFKDGGRRELGARRKSEGVLDIGGERKKAADDLKMKIAAQEKELRARVEKEALEREWELATRRRETRGGSVTGQNKNQKMRKQK